MFDFEEFVKNIAAHLPGWKFRSPDPEYAKHWQNIDGPNGASLSFCHNSRTKKVEVNPQYIRSHGTVYPSSGFRGDDPLVGSIHVSETRTPESAAKDIKRRVIDGYLPLYQKGKQQLAEIDAYIAAKAAVASEFARLLNDDEHREGSDTVTRYVYKPGKEADGGINSLCHVEIRAENAEDVKIKIDNCPVEVARQIIALFVKLRKGQRTA